MNQATRDVVLVTGCRAEEALRIQERMSQDGLDFSECTLREFRSAALQAARDLGVIKVLEAQRRLS